MPGPCRNGRARASAVANAHQRFSGTASHRPLCSSSWEYGMQPTGIVAARVGVGTRGAADRQQPVFVTTGEPTPKSWRIMTADPAIDGH